MISGLRSVNSINIYHMNLSKYTSLIIKPQILSFVVLILLGTASCTNTEEELAAFDDEQFEKERAEGVTFIFGQNGMTKSELYAVRYERITNIKPSYIDLLDSVHVDFYSVLQIVENQVTAEKARYYPDIGDIVLKNNVRVVTKDGDTLYTDDLYWSEKLEKIYTNSPIKIVNGPQVTTGQGLEANKDFSWVKVYKQKGMVPIKDSEQMGEDLE